MAIEMIQNATDAVNSLTASECGAAVQIRQSQETPGMIAVSNASEASLR